MQLQEPENMAGLLRDAIVLSQWHSWENLTNKKCNRDIFGEKSSVWKAERQKQILFSFTNMQPGIGRIWPTRSFFLIFSNDGTILLYTSRKQVKLRAAMYEILSKANSTPYKP